MASTSAATRDELRASVYVVVPAHEEETVLADVLRELGARYPNVVVVDDGSSDGTFRVAREHARFALRHVLNRGQGAALQTGLTFALRRGARYVVTFDADGQHRVEDVDALLDPIVRGECDVTLGSRFLGEAVGVPWSRRLTLKLAVLFVRLVNGVRLTDAHNGLRAFSRRAAEGIHLELDRMAHASEIIDQIRATGLPYREVPVTVRYSAYSMAKGQSSGNAFRIAFHYLVGRMTK